MYWRSRKQIEKVLFYFKVLLLSIFIFLFLARIPLFNANNQALSVESKIDSRLPASTSNINLKTPLIENKKSNSEIPTFITSREMLLSFAVLSFGVLVIFLEFYLIKSVKNKIEPQDILLIFTITLILVGTLFLIASGHTSQQIAPVLGLFGTIIGYLLGRETEKLFDKKARVKPNEIEEK